MPCLDRFVVALQVTPGLCEFRADIGAGVQAMMTMGITIMSTNTEIFCHCGPRVAFWPATSSGIVCALA